MESEWLVEEFDKMMSVSNTAIDIQTMLTMVAEVILGSVISQTCWFIMTKVVVWIVNLDSDCSPLICLLNHDRGKIIPLSIPGCMLLLSHSAFSNHCTKSASFTKLTDASRSKPEPPNSEIGSKNGLIS